MNREELKAKARSAARGLAASRGHVAPVDVFMAMGVLSKAGHDDWRFGRVDCLERVLGLNLSKLTVILREIAAYGRAEGLKPSLTEYRKWGKGPKRPLRFSRSGAGPVERLYSTHLVGRPRAAGGGGQAGKA
ncbi:MAG: hypothetical protein LBP92_15810 [Deltaproteobacteria bacterium]|nr:hypothetical protein [Deltaproteobacteria bacterium]